VAGALRQTPAGAGLVRAVSAAPDLDAWSLVENLLADLARLEDWLWLVVDDVHDLGAEALRQLELLVMRAPPQLRFVLAARHDVRLGLHRLRLEGELAEIRAGDLRFSLDEAGQLLAAAGVRLPAAALAALHGRTEGWAAGLRLAALALAGHPDPERLAAEFSGVERTVADYLLAEVEATWGIYQRMIITYREPDRRRGRELMVNLIGSVSSRVPKALVEVITLGRLLTKLSVNQQVMLCAGFRHSTGSGAAGQSLGSNG
jgi:hypothetical protein